MQFKDFEMWGLEEISQLDKIIKTEPQYDIAIYSSAEWARNKFYWREKNMEKVKNYENVNLFIYKIFDEMVLDTVLRLKKEFSLKVALYPHPYERFLKETYDIEPPYLKKIRDAGVEFNYNGNDSLQNIYSAKIAVAECSTIISDMWHLNLPALLFSGKGYEKEFQVDYNYNYLGKYQQYCFSSAGDLKEKILKFLPVG
jgi:hypothetical protein